MNLKITTKFTREKQKLNENNVSSTRKFITNYDNEKKLYNSHLYLII